MSSTLELAARTLALDLATGEVARAFDAAGIEGMVLKGPAMAWRLYRDVPGCRNYGDIDLLVAPWRFDDACRVLVSLGFEDHRMIIRASDYSQLEAWPLRRGRDGVVVDLHRGFHHVADRSAWWEQLSRHREELVVEGQPVAVPDRAGCAVIAVLHASRATSPAKPHEDLRRALQLFDDEVWRQAADIARSVGAGGAFAASLCAQRAGAELAARLGLTVTDLISWFNATSVMPGTSALCQLLAPGVSGLAGRARRAWDMVFPSRGALTASRPVAARGVSGLAAARLGRICAMAPRLSPLLLSFYRTSRALRPPAAATPGAPSGRPPGHSLAGRVQAVAGTSWWTLRAWWRVHRGLGHGTRRSGTSPAHVVLRGPATTYSRRAARLVLACCRATCLEKALIRQARAAGAGIGIDVIVGVTAPASGFRAHAWLDGDRVEPEFAELCRYPAAIGQPDQPRCDVLCPHPCPCRGHRAAGTATRLSPSRSAG
jgi:hypothetical protein